MIGHGGRRHVKLPGDLARRQTPALQQVQNFSPHRVRQRLEGLCKGHPQPSLAQYLENFLNRK